jgi:LacI family transcriptional regulator
LPSRMTGASLAEVAKASGVSLATASRVLNPHNDHPVSEAVRSRVLATAGELNYSVNALARGLKVKRTRTIAAIVHDFCDPYFNTVARGITDAADAAGYMTVLCNSNRDPDKELRYVQLAQEQRVAGVVFAGGGLASRRYRAAMRQQIANLRGYGAHAIALEPSGSRVPAEIPDNRGGAREATEHLVALGHERIAFIDGPAHVLTGRDRLKGYQDGLDAGGLELDERLVVSGGYTEEGGREALCSLLDAGLSFTAILASNDAMAIGCMGELASRGLKLPRDMSLVGFDDIPVVRWFDPPLTTVRVPMAEIGAAGVNRLLTLLDSEEAPPRGKLVNVHPTELIVRGTTGAPRAGKARR